MCSSGQIGVIKNISGKAPVGYMAPVVGAQSEHDRDSCWPTVFALRQQLDGRRLSPLRLAQW